MAKQEDIRQASRVCNFMLRLSRDPRMLTRWQRAEAIAEELSLDEFPFGDIAYGMALHHWIVSGRPRGAFFSYEETQIECPFLIEFRKEITEKFGLELLSKDEAKTRKLYVATLQKTVHDWGVN